MPGAWDTECESEAVRHVAPPATYPRLRERMFERRTLRREQARAAFSDVHVVFQAHAELAGNVNAWLVAEGHVPFQRALVAAYQVIPLVAIHADAMAKILVVRAVTIVDDDLACSRVYRFHGCPGMRGLQSRRLRLEHDVEDLFHLVSGLAQDEGAGDVAVVAIHYGVAVDQQRRPFNETLGRDRTMRQRRVFANVDARATGHAQTFIGGGQPIAHGVLRDARLQTQVDGVICRQRRVVGNLHQRQFGGALDGAAAAGDRYRRDQLRMRQGLGNARCAEIWHLFFYTKCPGRSMQVGHHLRQPLIGIFVFLPDPDIMTEFD